jgi:hypothetical protein
MKRQSGFGIMRIIQLVFLVILSWVLIHVYAAFGVFLAIGYLAVWLVSPSYLTCFYCKTFKSEKVRDYLCDSSLPRDNHHPQSLGAALYSTLLIFFLTGFCILVVYGEVQAYNYYISIDESNKTAYFVLPEERTYSVGEIFPMAVYVRGIGEPINVVRMDIKFDSEILEVEEVSFADSIVSLLVQKSIDNKTGFVRIVGGMPNPGYDEEEGILGTIFFRAKSSGIASIEYLPSSVLLANDGSGTNILKSFGSISYAIVPSVEANTEGAELVLGEDVLGVAREAEAERLVFYDDQIIEKSFDPEDLENTEERITTFRRVLDMLVLVDTYLLDFWIR